MKSIDISRRHFLAGGTASLIAGRTAWAGPSSRLRAGLNDAVTAITPDTLLKFNSDGSPRAFSGNTIICPLPAQSRIREAVTDLRSDLHASSFHEKVGLTPPDSYHMTVFSGPTDFTRDHDAWPAYVPRDAPMERCNEDVLAHMEALTLNCALPLQMRIDAPETLSYPAACSIKLAPGSPEEKMKLQHIRRQFADAYGFRPIDRDLYQFHITVSYQLKPFTAEEHDLYKQTLQRHLVTLSSIGNIELGLPEYCTFSNMFRFEPRKLIACKG